MKRIHCIVEGPTEVSVFTSLLTPYIQKKTGAYIIFTSIKYTDGGIVKFSKMFKEFKEHLKDKEKIVTTFFDYYGINRNHNFKYYDEAKSGNLNKKEGVELLEKGMKESLAEKGYNVKNFVPYIQLHEFEALLFSSIEGFNFQFDSPRVIKELEDVIKKHPNPEEINDSSTTAPSKRIIKIVETTGRDRYNKVVDGESIAMNIGIEKILEKCPRFNNWVSLLIEKSL